MATVQDSGSQAQIDPDDLIRMEVSTNRYGEATLKLYLKGVQRPRVIEFESKKKAIDFYDELWRKRQLDREDLVEVGDLN